jgi:uncharacterized membrane protein
MKIHPVHMMVVHFPAALLPVDFIFQMSSLYFENEPLGAAAYYCLAAGVIGGWFAIVTGLYDVFTRVLKPGGPIPKAAIWHAGLQVCVILAFTLILSLSYHEQAYIYHPPVWMWILKACLLGVMLAGNYFGGELVLRHVVKET